MLREQHRAACAKVGAIYKELASRPLERNCVNRSECCHFRLTGRTPNLTWPEALFAAQGVRALGKKQLAPKPGGSCPLLDDRTGKCTVYEHRPFGCRTHFCKSAGGPYARGEVRDLIHQLEDLGQALGKTEAMNLPVAIAQALQVQLVGK